MNDIVKTETQETAAWMDSEPEALQQAIELRDKNRQQLLAWVRKSLVEGTDFGRIHFAKNCDSGKNCTNDGHFSKPSLWKAGAEKIVGMLGFRAEWPELKEVLAEVRTGGQTVALRCVLISPTGDIVSEGIGARSLKQDYGDPNKALKMAKKSGLIDAVLNAAGLSEVFTQDLSHEDTPDLGSPLTDEGVDYLWGIAKDLYGDKATKTLESLAKRRFRISDGDWKQIPDHRLGDAVRSLEEKAK